MHTAVNKCLDVVRRFRMIHENLDQTNLVILCCLDWLSQPASVAQCANALAESQCSEPDWLGQATWVRLPLLPACRVRFLHAMRLFLGRYRGFACVLFQMW